jgi:hypothetical protein
MASIIGKLSAPRRVFRELAYVTDITRIQTQNNGTGLANSVPVYDAAGDLNNNSDIFTITGDDVALKGTCSSQKFVSLSDRRLKFEIERLSELQQVERIMALRPCSFKWRNDEHGDAVVGLIAQEVQQVIPSAVEQTKSGLGIDYPQLIAVMLGAMKAQEKHLALLESRIVELEDTRYTGDTFDISTFKA